MQAGSLDVRTVLGQRCEVIAASFGASAFDRHFHDTFSIGYVASGVNAFSYRRRRIEVRAGAVCIANPGEVHDGGLAGTPWSYMNVFVPAALLSEISQESDGLVEPGFREGAVSEPETCRQVFSFLNALIAADTESAMADELALLAFGRLLGKHATGRAITDPSVASPVARRAIEVMADSWGKGVSLDQLARETGKSRYAVIRAVSSAIGLTPVSYMVQLRVQRAKRLIRDGMPLAEAALETGFADQSHLTRAMKRRWGITPGRLIPR